MKNTKAIWIAQGFLAFLAPLVVSAQGEGVVLRVPAKGIPVPTTVSPELAKVIAKRVPPITRMPTTADQWRTLKLTHDAAGTKAAQAAAKLLGVKVFQAPESRDALGEIAMFFDRYLKQ